jgi:hypothetical protein
MEKRVIEKGKASQILKYYTILVEFGCVSFRFYFCIYYGIQPSITKIIIIIINNKLMLWMLFFLVVNPTTKNKHNSKNKYT